MKTQNIEKKLTAGGKDTPKLNMEKFIQLADKDKIQSDIEGEIIRLLNENLEIKGNLERALVIGLIERQKMSC